MISKLVPLPTGQCSPVDCARAFFCAEAVLREQNSEIEEFLKGIQMECPFFEFGKVHVSIDFNSNHGFKFLMAYAADAIFIALQVDRRFKDSIGSDYWTLPSGDSVDGGDFRLFQNFWGPDLDILSVLSCMRKRIVVWGHGFAGAVAHMVVLHLWAAYSNCDDKIYRGQDEMISIAFGAPDICSSVCAEKVNGNEELKSHFYGFVYEDDPINSILYGREDHDDEDFVDEAGRGGYLEGGSAGFRNKNDRSFIQ